jgi:phosphoribosyl-AMP cyclohydrolase / phosphoribosyl-ATP pyrophosphohydrolase
MTRVVSAGAIRFDPRDGLVSAVVQDALDGRVLMVASMDAEALAATLASGEVHFHSRSRNSLWRKGETSGNVLRLLRIEPDCDGDALLVTVEPVGPTCHRGTRSCFDPPGEAEAVSDRAADGADPVTDPTAEPVAATDPATDAQGFAWLEELWVTLAERAAARPAGSYTADLLAGGVDAVGRKVTEEATEVLLAAKDDATAQVTGADRVAPRGALAGESADLLYHLLVLLLERGLRPAEVLDVLRSRHRR